MGWGAAELAESLPVTKLADHDRVLAELTGRQVDQFREDLAFALFEPNTPKAINRKEKRFKKVSEECVGVGGVTRPLSHHVFPLSGSRRLGKRGRKKNEKGTHSNSYSLPFVPDEHRRGGDDHEIDDVLWAREEGRDDF